MKNDLKWKNQRYSAIESHHIVRNVSVSCFTAPSAVHNKNASVTWMFSMTTDDYKDFSEKLPHSFLNMY